MKKLFTLVLAMAMAVSIAAFTTYRVVMNNLVIDEVDYGYTVTLFGHTDQYVVREPRYYFKAVDGVELYSPTSDEVSASDAVFYDSDIDSLFAWLKEEEIPGYHIGDWIYIHEDACQKDLVIQTAMNCFCIAKVENGVISIMPYFYWAGSDSWDITGVQPVY